MLQIKLQKRELISFVGGGGKTTTMFKLAKELRAIGKSILVTTTTAIFYPDKRDYDQLVVTNGDHIDITGEKGRIIVWGREISLENKLLGISKEKVEEVYRLNEFDYILVEADGAKKRPIKAPASHEPVIPNNTSKTVGVIGLDSMKRKINDENVHRPELFCKITNSKLGEEISSKRISTLIIEEKGLFKDTPPLSERYLLLNKADNQERIDFAHEIKELVLRSGINLNGIIIGSMGEDI